jgi:beta-lactamase regulating signal transducer with metallopeptidase domain
MSEVFAHLWSSTLVLLVALIVARLLPLTARTRHALLYCGLLKFAIPSAAIIAPLAALGLDLTNIGRRSTGSISIDWLGGPVALRTLPHPAVSTWGTSLMIAWIVSAAVLAIAWAIARRRLVHSALLAASPASPRERAALADVRLELGLRASVEVMRSPICEAPAVVRIIRPVIILPESGCDDLDDVELRSLLRHECAHVARRDNLLGLAEATIVSAFWFHPLIWIAQRSIATAREEACDETAAGAADGIDTYISALSKICRAVLAPRLAGVSCMANAHLKERLNHLMRYDSLRRHALSHRLVVTVAATAVLAFTVGTGVRAARASDSKATPFKLNFVVRPGQQSDTLVFRGRVIEVATDALLAEPNVTFKRGSTASVRTVAEGRDIQIDIRDTGTSVNAVMRVLKNGVQQQESSYSVEPQTDRPRNSRYTGDLISLDLKDADIKDVLDKFGKITSINIQYPPTLKGKLTLNVRDMPWDEAFEIVLRQQNLTWEMNKGVITIKE